MTLNEAIRYAEEQADLLEESAKGCDLTDKVEQEIACKSGKCAEEHRQLAEWLKDYKRLLEYDDAKYHEEHGEVIVDKDVWEDAKKALEAVADGDRAVSLNAVLQIIDEWFDDREAEIEDLIVKVTYMPSVSRTGHWISRESKGQVLPFWSRYECSECGECAEKNNFCPNCGADMREDGD